MRYLGHGENRKPPRRVSSAMLWGSPARASEAREHQISQGRQRFANHIRITLLYISHFVGDGKDNVRVVSWISCDLTSFFCLWKTMWLTMFNPSESWCDLGSKVWQTGCKAAACCDASSWASAILPGPMTPEITASSSSQVCCFPSLGELNQWCKAVSLIQRNSKEVPIPMFHCLTGLYFRNVPTIQWNLKLWVFNSV